MRAHSVRSDGSSSRASQARASAQCRLTVAGETPIGLGGFLDRQPAEEAELDDAGLAGVELGEPGQRGVERDHVERSFGSRRRQPLVEGDARLRRRRA